MLSFTYINNFSFFLIAPLLQHSQIFTYLLLLLLLLLFASLTLPSFVVSPSFSSPSLLSLLFFSYCPPPPPPSLIFSLISLYFALFSPLLSLLGPSLMMTRLKEIVPDIRVMEAHGQHTDLEDRIDYFSSGQV